MSKNVLVPISDGCEEIEAACIIDVLRRADTDVTVASVGNLQVTASRGMKLVADRLICCNMRFPCDSIASPRTSGRAKGNCVSGLCRTACKY